MPIDFPLIELLSIYYIDFTIGIKFLIIPAIYFNYDRRLFLKKKCFFLQSKKIIFLIKYYLHIYAQHIIYISKRKHLNSTDNQIANINFLEKKNLQQNFRTQQKTNPTHPQKITIKFAQTPTQDFLSPSAKVRPHIVPLKKWIRPFIFHVRAFTLPLRTQRESFFRFILRGQALPRALSAFDVSFWMDFSYAISSRKI